MAIIDTRRPKQRESKGQNIQLGLNAAQTGMNLANMIARIQHNRAQVDAMREQAKLENNVSWYNKFLGNREKTISMFSEAIENAGKKYGYGSEQQKKVRSIAAKYINLINSKIGGTATPEQIAMQMERAGQRKQTGGADLNAIVDNTQNAAIAESERKAKMNYEQAASYMGDTNFNAGAELAALENGPVPKINPNSQFTRQQAYDNAMDMYKTRQLPDGGLVTNVDPELLAGAKIAGMPLPAGQEQAVEGYKLAYDLSPQRMADRYIPDKASNPFTSPTITASESGATTTGPMDGPLGNDPPLPPPDGYGKPPKFDPAILGALLKNSTGR